MRSDASFFLTSLALISGDLSLYLGMKWAFHWQVTISGKETIQQMKETALTYLTELFQGLSNITEAAYCQVGVDGVIHD